MLLRTAQTLYQVPHLALGAEITTGYRERSVLMSWNTACSIVGTFGTYFLAWTWFGTLESTETSRSAVSTATRSNRVFLPFEDAPWRRTVRCARTRASS